MNKTTIRKLDRVFSEFIRLRDTDDRGVTKCISCGRLVKYEDTDCGHYINRAEMSTRYDEKNCNAQCRHCNRFREGNALGYTRGLIKKYGEGVLTELEVKKNNVTKLTDFEGELLVKYYRRKVKELKKNTVK